MGCVSGSYGWGHLVQIVPLVAQLQARGFAEEAAEKLLDSEPALAFSVFYGGPLDCDADVRVSNMRVPQNPVEHAARMCHLSCTAGWELRNVLPYFGGFSTCTRCQP